MPELVQECAKIDPDFGQLLDAAELVSPYAWKFRYPHTDEHGVLISIEPTEDEADEALRLARDAFAFVLARLPAPTHP